MWKYIIYGVLMAYVAYWLIAVIRKRIVHEIYMACGIGCYFTLISLGWSWTGLGILPLQILGLVLYAPAILFATSLIEGRLRRLSIWSRVKGNLETILSTAGASALLAIDRK